MIEKFLEYCSTENITCSFTTFHKQGFRLTLQSQQLQRNDTQPMSQKTHFSSKEPNLSKAYSVFWSCLYKNVYVCITNHSFWNTKSFFGFDF